jgi:DNA polymerase-3 subunit delta
MLISRRPDIERFLGRPPAEIKAAVIHGRDRAVVRERADTLAGQVVERPDDPFDTALLTEGDIEGESGKLEGELAALSMMGGRRLVRLRISGEKAGPDRAATEALTAHMAGELNPEAFFLIESGALDRNSLLRRAAEKAPGCAVIPCYEDEAGDVARMTRETLAKDRLSLEGAALDLFVSRMPHERGVARQEIERLALFLGPGRPSPGTAAELIDFLGVEPEASLSDAAQDAFGGRPAAAQAHLRRAAQEGEGGVSAVRMLSIHAGRLRKILTQAAGGAGLQEAAKSAGVFWKNEREVLRQARAWTLAALDELAPDLLAADIACKSTGSPDTLLAERLAMTIAGKARRLGL